LSEQVTWIHSKYGSYNVKSGYNMITKWLKDQQSSSSEEDSINKMWKKKKKFRCLRLFLNIKCYYGTSFIMLSLLVRNLTKGDSVLVLSALDVMRV